MSHAAISWAYNTVAWYVALYSDGVLEEDWKNKLIGYQLINTMGKM